MLYSNKPTVQDFIDKYGGHWPALNAFSLTEQDKEWHAEGNVHIHTDMVLEELYKLIEADSYIDFKTAQILMYAAALHDYGKPYTTKPVERPDGMHIGAPRHEEVGASLLLLSKGPDGMSKEDWLQVIKLIAYHQMPKKLVLNDACFRDYVKLLDKAGDLKMLGILEKADMLGRTCEDMESNLLYVNMFNSFVKDYGLEDSTLFLSGNGYDNKKLYYMTLESLDDSDMSIANRDYLSHVPSPTVTILCGLPASGKSTYAANFKGSVISLDSIRDELGGRGKAEEDEVLRVAYVRFRELLRTDVEILWDATNYRRDFRTKIADLAVQYGYFTKIVVIVTDLYQCIRNDSKREHNVGPEVILNQFKKFQLPSIDEVYQVEFI